MQLSFWIGFNADEGHRLPEASLCASAFQSRRLELFSDIKRCELPATRASAAAFQPIVRKKFDVSTQGAFTNRARQRCARRDSLGDCAESDADDRESCDEEISSFHSLSLSICIT